MIVTWNGTAISGPVLIYQDELVVDDRNNVTGAPINGTLECRSEDQTRADWRTPTGNPVSMDTDIGFREIMTSLEEIPSVSRLTALMENTRHFGALYNGLWTCRLNQSRSSPIPVPVGIYIRGTSEELIC